MGDKEQTTDLTKQAGDAAQLMNDPNVMASLQAMSLDSKSRALSYYQNLAAPIKRRVKALKKLQFETIKLESDFYKELNELEVKYAAKYQPHFERRRDVLNGEVEPNDEDCNWPSDEEDVENVAKDVNKIQLEGDKQEEVVETKNGIPDFWLTIFRNVQILDEMIEEHDVPILKTLRDVTFAFNTTEDEPGFTLFFHFAPNEFFTDSVLTKQYFVKFDPMSTDPFSFEGPEIVKAKGCEIHWKSNKNVTVKMMKKVQKHKGRGEKRTVTKAVKTDSFFNFFDPPSESLDNPDTEDLDPDTEQLLQSDFEIGQFLRERVVPRAVLFFTGEALEEDDDYGEEEEEGEEEDFDEDDEKETTNIVKHGGKGKHAAEGNPECKQQ